MPPLWLGSLCPTASAPRPTQTTLKVVSWGPMVPELPRVAPELLQPLPRPTVGHQQMPDGGRCTVPPPRPKSSPVLTPHPLPPGSQEVESLLTRARCYGFLGQKKTAMFDFNSVLRAEPKNVQALCGRALLQLALGRQKVPGPPCPPGTGQAGLGEQCSGKEAPGHCFPSQPPGEREQGQAVLSVRPVETSPARGAHGTLIITSRPRLRRSVPFISSVPVPPASASTGGARPQGY